MLVFVFIKTKTNLPASHAVRPATVRQRDDQRADMVRHDTISHVQFILVFGSDFPGVRARIRALKWEE